MTSVDEKVTVCVRMRPLNNKELARNDTQVWKQMDDLPGHIQMLDNDGKPVTKSTGNSVFAYGENNDSC